MPAHAHAPPSELIMIPNAAPLQNIYETSWNLTELLRLYGVPTPAFLVTCETIKAQARAGSRL